MVPDQCRVTIMFDGSEDVKNQPIINILMRVMGGSRGSLKTFFLKSFYSRYDTCDASYYVDMVEKVVEEFGGFGSVAGIVTDNTSAVLNAREMLEQKYGRLVASQDQAHVADLLMSDIGEIPWMKETLVSVTSIGTYLRRFRKLRAKVVEMTDKHNDEVRKLLAHIRKENPQRKKNIGETCTEDDSMARRSSPYDGDEAKDPDLPEDDERDDTDDEDGDSNVPDDKLSTGDTYSSAEEGGHRGAPRVVTVNNILSAQIHSAVRELGQIHEEEEDIVSPSADQLNLNSEAEINSCAGDVPRFARLMKKVSAVRFASLEKLLTEYKTLRKVLLELVSIVNFESLCSLKNEREKRSFAQNFTLPIKDDRLFHKVVQVHAIMKACRLYLRMFDSESCLISEVFRATSMLEQTFRNLPHACFPEPQEENRRELLEVLRNRIEGPIAGRKKVKITLVSNLHVAAALLDPYRCPFDIFAYKRRLREHLERYLCGSGTEFRNELDKDEFIVEMMNQYDIVHSLWKEKGYVRADSERTSAAERRESQGLSSLRSLRERSPISWWTAGSVRLPKDGLAKKAAMELVEYAVRTLSVSPTATATERTFSHLSRIQPKQRSGLSRDRVEKLLFCQWNLRVLRKVANPYEVDVQTEAKKQNLGIEQLRAHRKHVTTMSFLGSLRSNAEADRPVVAEPVTAQNEPTPVAGKCLTVERDNAIANNEANRPNRRDLLVTNETAGAPCYGNITHEKQIVRVPSPRPEPSRESPDIARKESNAERVIDLEDLIRAAKAAGYAIRGQQGGQLEDTAINITPKDRSGGHLQNRGAQTHLQIHQGIRQGNTIYVDEAMDEGGTRRFEDHGQVEEGTRKRKRKRTQNME